MRLPCQRWQDALPLLYDDWYVASCMVVATLEVAMLPLLAPALVIRNQVLSAEISGMYLMPALAGYIKLRSDNPYRRFTRHL